MTVLKMDRTDVVDTSDMDVVMFHVPTRQARTYETMPDEMARIIGRLVMGQPVPRAQLRQWGLVTLRMMSADDPSVAELARLGFEPVDLNTVVPLRRAAIIDVEAPAEQE